MAKNLTDNWQIAEIQLSDICTPPPPPPPHPDPLSRAIYM